MEITLDKQNNRDSTDIAQDIKSVISALRQLTHRQLEKPAYTDLVETVAGELTSIAEQGKSYSEACQVIHSYQEATDLFGSALVKMLADVERLEQARIRREKYSERWYEQCNETLQHAFHTDPEAAYQQWMLLYAQALVDWELGICRRLASIPLPHPRDKYPYVLLIGHGTASLQSRDYPPALRMLNYLVDQLSGATADEPRLLGALLSIFMGRICLYTMKEPRIATEHFDRAAMLAPGDGRPLAASGHLAFEQGDNSLAEANRLFSHASNCRPINPRAMLARR